MADKQPPKTKKYFRSTKSGAGMTKAGVKRYRAENPGSKLKTAVTGKVKKGSKAAKRRKSYCARSAGQMKKFPKAAKDPNSRLRQARKRWKCQKTVLHVDVIHVSATTIVTVVVHDEKQLVYISYSRGNVYIDRQSCFR